MRQSLGPLLFCGLVLCVSAIARADDTAASARMEEGANIYDKYCSTCHGEELHNNSGAAFDLRRLHPQEFPRFVNSVIHGKKAMPAWGAKLSQEQIESLWAYIRANAYDAN